MNIKEQFLKLNKRIFTWEHKLNSKRRFNLLIVPHLLNPTISKKFKKEFITIFVSYRNKSKLMTQARNIINEKFNNQSIEQKILDYLKNPGGLVDFSFKILIPLSKGSITNKELNRAKFRIAKKIKIFKRKGVLY